MADNSGSEKTEKPTPRKRREARERGQVARTPELGVWAAVLATTILLQITVQRASVVMHDVLDRMGGLIAEPDAAAATGFAVDSLLKAAIAVAPMLVGMMFLALVVGIGQVGFKPTAKQMKPDFSRLNPFKGFKRMLSPATWWEVGKAVLKVALLTLIALPAMSNAMRTLTSQGASMGSIAAYTGHTTLTILRNISIVGLGVAAADYAVQRYRLTRQLRMTRQELREELKQQEGNPDVRRAVRTRAMAISRNRMIRAVSMADVVVVNPTHYAVALAYEADRGAPQVVAKGAGVIAGAIRAEAERHGVPLVHEPVLTRALYRGCEIGQLIPVELYEAVAHLLAFVFGLRARGRPTDGPLELPRPALL